jgi:hypothetical protein
VFIRGKTFSLKPLFKRELYGRRLDIAVARSTFTSSSLLEHIKTVNALLSI